MEKKKVLRRLAVLAMTAVVLLQGTGIPAAQAVTRRISTP